MPNRYEREIEEILRNLEHTEPRAGRGQKLSGGPRRQPVPHLRVRQHRLFSLHLSPSAWLLTIAVIAALVSGGYAYLRMTYLMHEGADIFSTLLAIVSIVCLILLATSQFVARPQRTQSVRYGNVTVTPLHRNPLRTFKSRWDLFFLKLRYRRRKED